MTDDQLAQLIAALVGIVVTALWRLVDRFLPDDTGRHPTPDPPIPSRKPDATILPVDPPTIEP